MWREACQVQNGPKSVAFAGEVIRFVVRHWSGIYTTKNNIEIFLQDIEVINSHGDGFRLCGDDLTK